MIQKLHFRKEILADVDTSVLIKENLSYQIISKARSGMSLALDDLLKFAEHFKTNISYLFCLTEDSSPLDYYTLDERRFRFNSIKEEQKERSRVVSIIEATGISSATLTKITKGDLPKKLAPLFSYAEYFGVSLDYLYGLTYKRQWGEPYTPPPLGSVISFVQNGTPCFAVVTLNGRIKTTLGNEFSMIDFCEKRINYVEVVR